jgi:hypothetical protein
MKGFLLKIMENGGKIALLMIMGPRDFSGTSG